MEERYMVPQNPNQRELLEHGTVLFPCAVYDRDIRQYLDGEISLHWHKEMEIFLVIDGEARVVLGDEECVLRPGEGYVVNSNVLHGVFSSGSDGCHYHSIVFDSVILSGMTGSVYDLLYVTPFLERGGRSMTFCSKNSKMEEEIALLFEKAFFCCKGKERGYEFLTRNILSQLFLLLTDVMPQRDGGTQSRQENRLKEMPAWLEEHYREPITIRQLADVCGICVRECQRTFSNFLHLTPVEYIHRRRITEAAKELVSSDQSVIDIALSCGFQDPSYFAKQFKTVTGMTPREYRKRNGGMKEKE